MVLGMTPFLAFHVAVSLIAIIAGVVVLRGLLANDRMDGATMTFIATAVITDATGFPLPPFGLDPPRILGIISLVVLAICIVARYLIGLRGIWRGIYAATAVMALYFNVFVLVTQLFNKFGPLHVLAPKGSEPPFAIAQGAVLILFVYLGYRAVKRFRPA